jgi:hypothetical protein
VQTENIGFENMRMLFPNIRYLVLGGPESEGHLTGEALKALISNGVHEKKRIIGTNAPHPFLFNLPMKFIERFRIFIHLVWISLSWAKVSFPSGTSSCDWRRKRIWQGFRGLFHGKRHDGNTRGRSKP